jgi:hypothetical protein
MVPVSAISVNYLPEYDPPNKVFNCWAGNGGCAGREPAVWGGVFGIDPLGVGVGAAAVLICDVAAVPAGLMPD